MSNRLVYTTATPTPAEVAHRQLNPTVRHHVAPSRRSLIRMHRLSVVCDRRCVLFGMVHDRCDIGQ